MDRLIDSHQLRVFTTLASLLSMNECARALNLTPSAISHCLKSLETDLGCRLMVRHSRRMALSANGRRLLEDANDILERMKAARKRLQCSAKTRAVRHQIASHPAIGQAVFPSVLREFRNSFPDHNLAIETLTTVEAMARLQEDTLDFALVVQPVAQPSLSFMPLVEDELTFVAHPLHTWAVKRRVLREQIGRRSLIMPEGQGDTFSLIAAYFKSEGSIEPLMEVTDEEVVKRLVQLNLGVGILPSWRVAQEIQQGTLTPLPLGRRRLRRSWGILHRRDHTPGLAHSLLIDLIRDAMRELVAPAVR